MNGMSRTAPGETVFGIVKAGAAKARKALPGASLRLKTRTYRRTSAARLESKPGTRWPSREAG